MPIQGDYAVKITSCSVKGGKGLEGLGGYKTATIMGMSWRPRGGLWRNSLIRNSI
jgi:hypothetical protein